jgi:hypothetical protein
MLLNHIMMIKTNALQRRLLKLADTAIQGGLSETTRTCGNPRCPCHQDPAKRHGPHLYLTFRTPDRRSSGMYIPREHERDIRASVAAWAKLWETIVDIGARNRERLRQSMQRSTQAKRRKPSVP